jgi:hypothetical protein
MFSEMLKCQMSLAYPVSMIRHIPFGDVFISEKGFNQELGRCLMQAEITDLPNT